MAPERGHCLKQCPFELAEATPEAIREWIDQRQDSGLSGLTINSSLTEVQQIRREPAWVVTDVSVDRNIEKLRQLVIFAKIIDWIAVRKSDVSQEILSSMPDTLSLIF